MADFKKLFQEKKKEAISFNPDSFDDFEEDRAIAREIREAANKICYGRVKCLHCGANFGSCIEVSFQIGGGSMLPRPGGGQQNAFAGNNNRGQAGKRQGYDYITTDMLSADKVRCKIFAAQETPEPTNGRRKYSDVQIQVAFKGRTMLLGIKADNPNYETLVNELGYNPNDWAGKEFFIFSEGPDFSGRFFARVEMVPYEEQATAPPVTTKRRS